MKYTFRQFQKQYATDDACLDAILAKRYARIDHCPKCGVESKLTRIQGRRAYACKEGCHVYPCAGTIFEHSSTPLTMWFHAMYLMTATRNGVSAKEIERQLGVTYKCAWRIGHQLRLLMAARAKADGFGQLSGHIEIDETYVGGRRRSGKPGRSKENLKNKGAVFGMVERDGEVRGIVVPNDRKATLIPIIKRHIAEGSTISSDAHYSYRNLSDEGYAHGYVNHLRGQWKNGDICTNRIENFWSHLKRGITSTHISVSPKHLQKYVDEFAYRRNMRLDPEGMFSTMLRQISNPTFSL